MARKFIVKASTKVEASVSATPWKDRLWSLCEDDQGIMEVTFNEMFAMITEDDAQDICYNALGIEPGDFDDDNEEY